jgi:hypothetical protein
MALALGSVALPSLAGAQTVETPDAAEPVSDDAVHFARWVSASGDNRGLPFIVIDKVAAAVFVYDRTGESMGTTPALLGVAQGDDTVPGIGDREMSAVRPHERTTPAGRFLAKIGPAIGHRKVLWVDYGSSIALHPIVPGTKRERRAQRLKSPSSEDNRITYGCINVSASFYENVIRTLLGNDSGVVYILPETKPLSEVFPTFRAPEQPSLQTSFGR